MTSENEIWHNRYVELSAEFKKHKMREMKMQSAAIADAKQDLLEEFIRLLDEMRLMLMHCDDSPITTGFRMIVGKMERLLNDEGYERVSPVRGDAFKPELHNAICLVQAGSNLSNRIVECVRDGWIRDGRQLRAADVKVGA